VTSGHVIGGERGAGATEVVYDKPGTGPGVIAPPSTPAVDEFWRDFPGAGGDGEDWLRRACAWALAKLDASKLDFRPTAAELPRTVAAWIQTLLAEREWRPSLDREAFGRAVLAIMASDRRWPSPARFLEEFGRQREVASERVPAQLALGGHVETPGEAADREARAAEDLLQRRQEREREAQLARLPEEERARVLAVERRRRAEFEAEIARFGPEGVLARRAAKYRDDDRRERAETLARMTPAGTILGGLMGCLAAGRETAPAPDGPVETGTATGPADPGADECIEEG
jgi:hypothetical protein